MYAKDLKIIKISAEDEDKKIQEKKVIPCAKINVLELDEQEQKDLRTFYWAAFFGMKKYV